jgi:hypothetical protein
MANFNHGVGTLIKEITTSKGTIAVGSKGILTAYLPEEGKYAVDFGNGQWITFDAVSFLEYCEVKLNDN